MKAKSKHKGIQVDVIKICLGCFLGWKSLFSAHGSEIEQVVTKALASEDPAEIEQAVQRMNRHLGPRLGVPEVKDRFVRIPMSETVLTRSELRKGFLKSLKEISSNRKIRWWRIGMNPLEMDHALREPAEIVSWSAAAAQSGFDRKEVALKWGEEAAEFMMWAQETGGRGVFPFPAYQGRSKKREVLVAQRYLQQAEREGRLEDIVHNGWAISDTGDGGLQFDNGLCGVALLELYAVTKKEKYLESARQAADWALEQPLVANWNYNSFSVYLLSAAYRETKDQRYLDAAIQKAMLGVLPGQLQQGQYAGRWNDPHNARPVYHYIIMRSLAHLVKQVPENHPNYPSLRESLILGLVARNKEFLTHGVSVKDVALEVLVFINLSFHDDQELMAATHSREALEGLLKVISSEARKGHYPLKPKAWGMFLHYVEKGKNLSEKDSP